MSSGGKDETSPESSVVGSPDMVEGTCRVKDFSAGFDPQQS